MASFKTDYEFGKKCEDDIFASINLFFNDNIIKSSSKYQKYDYKGNKCYYELKSRNNNHNSYSTTLIPYNKIMENEKQIFLFKFNDGLYYIEYDPLLFSNFDLKYFVRNRRIDYNDKMSMYYYIPIDKLKKIL